MKPTSPVKIHLTLGAAVLLAMALLYVLLVHDGQPRLSPRLSLSGWAVFGAAALALVLMAWAPGLLRGWRGLSPPQTLSRSDTNFYIMVAVAGCALAVAGVFSGMWWLMVLGIMLAPLSSMFRRDRA